MKLISAFAVVGLVTAASPAQKWAEFKKTHSKVYKSLAEESKRFNQFKKNLDFIANHNSKHARGEESYHVAINKFADLSAAEFEQIHLADMESVGIRLNQEL